MKYKCGVIEKPYCLAPGVPWFHKTLRVCSDSSTNVDSIPVALYDIYVK